MTQEPNVEQPAVHWQQLVNTAILGTERNALLPADTFPWAMSTATDTTDQFLDLAGALAIYELAGKQPNVNHSPAIEVKPCDVQEAMLDPRTTAHLIQILYGDQSDLLEQWVDAACQTQRCVEPELLSALLHRASNRSGALQQKLLQLVGQRGKWLAQMHPTWHRLYNQPSLKTANKTWETAKLEQRLVMLNELIENEPSTAREFVQNTWEQESADARVKMLQIFTDHINADDETWLESLLDDRSKQVKTLTSQMLSTLPDSALSLRMAQRLESYVQFKPAKGLMKRNGKLSITLQDEIDQSMSRDGLEAKGSQGMGAKAALFSRIVALTALRWWEQQEPQISKWLKITLNHEWALPLFHGFKHAILTQNNLSWASQFVTDICLPKAPGKSVITDELREEALSQLLEMLPDDTLEALANESLQTLKNNAISRIDILLKACRTQWNHAMSLNVIDMLKIRLASKDIVYNNPFRQFITQVVSVRLSIEAADTFATLLNQDQDHWSDNFRTMLQSAVKTVHFRKDMLTAINQTP
ncbi:MAG: DUF5691 domain-containing protein [Phycisphaeraceae bacterium JB051]